jgi:HlyD family secretion protein
MNASVAFFNSEKSQPDNQAKPLITIQASALRDNAVFIVIDGKAVRREVQVAAKNSQGIQIEKGLIGGEDLIVNPPANLTDGQKVSPKKG